MLEFIDALIEGYKDHIQTYDRSPPNTIERKHSIKRLAQSNISNKKFTTPVSPDDISPDNRRNSQRRNTIRYNLDNIGFNMVLRDAKAGGSEISSLGWDEYQDLKLIFYSINFRGKDYLPTNELYNRIITIIRVYPTGNCTLQSSRSEEHLLNNT